MSEAPLKLTAYLEIKDRILNCTYAPGAVMNEETLRTELKMSRTPIRDAIGRLEQEGLLTIMPKRGIVVSELSIRGINELYEARLRLEPYAVLNYGCRLSDTAYEEYYHEFSQKAEVRPPAELYELDDAFHWSFIHAADNRYLTNLYDMLSGQVIRFRIASGQRIGQRLDVTQVEHQQIAKACLCRNWAEAAEAMRRHILSSKESILNIAIAQPERFLPGGN